MENRLQNQKQDALMEVQSWGNCESFTRNNDQCNDLWGQSSSAVGVKTESGLETAHIKLELDDADSRTTSESPPREIDQFEPLIRIDSNVFESETVLEFCIKEEEDGAEFDEYGSVIDTLSKENLQCDEQVSLLRNSQDLSYKICNIKQEEVEDDNGIIGGFLEDFEDDVLLENEYNTEKIMQEQFESHYPQLETTKSPAIPSYIDKRLTICEESTVSLRPELSAIASTADREVNQNFERNAPQDVSTMQDKEIQLQGILQMTKTACVKETDNSCDSYKKTSDNLECTAEGNVCVDHHDTRITYEKKSTTSSSVERHEKVDARKRSYPCHVCEESFTQEDSLKLHSMIHTRKLPFLCAIGRESFRFNKSSNQQVQGQHTEERTRSCEVCEENLISSSQFEGHRITEKCPCSYNICGQAFEEEQYLTDHKKRQTGEERHSCYICRKLFMSLSNFEIHIRTHFGEKPYSCNICNKSFRTKGNLKGHTLLHTREKPYSCDFCEKSFKSRAYLKGHSKIHTEEKSHTCDICGKRFMSSNKCERHKMIHSGEKPFSCDLCHKMFTSSSNCESHKETHSAEKPYSCDICGKKFKGKRYATEHKRIHTGEKLHSCDFCQRRFFSSSSWERHTKIHTREKPYS